MYMYLFYIYRILIASILSFPYYCIANCYMSNNYLFILCQLYQFYYNSTLDTYILILNLLHLFCYYYISVLLYYCILNIYILTLYLFYIDCINFITGVLLHY